MYTAIYYVICFVYNIGYRYQVSRMSIVKYNIRTVSHGECISSLPHIFFSQCYIFHHTTIIYGKIETGRSVSIITETWGIFILFLNHKPASTAVTAEYFYKSVSTAVTTEYINIRSERSVACRNKYNWGKERIRNPYMRDKFIW